MNIFARGIAFALGAAIISGVSIFINKFAVDSITPPLVFTATKNIIVGVCIFAYLLSTKKLVKIKSLSLQQKIKLLVISIIGGSLPFYLFFTGLSQTSAINATIIQKTLVIWVALLALPLLKEKITLRQGIIIGILFYSNTFVGGFKGFIFSQGELMILIATLLWSIETIVAKKVLGDIDTDIVVGARMGLGAMILLGAAFVLHPTKVLGITALNSMQWFWLVATSITLFGYVMTWYRALKYAPAITVTAILVGATLITNILSAIFITRSWNILLTFQALLLAGSISLLIVEIKASLRHTLKKPLFT